MINESESLTQPPSTSTTPLPASNSITAQSPAAASSSSSSSTFAHAESNSNKRVSNDTNARTVKRAKISSALDASGKEPVADNSTTVDENMGTDQDTNANQKHENTANSVGSSTSPTSLNGTTSQVPQIASSPLSSNPYAIYLAACGSGTATNTSTIPPMNNPYYYLTLPNTMSMYYPNPVPGPGSTSRPVVPTPSASSLPKAKPKRPKSHTPTTKSHSVPLIPRDPNTHLPLLPLTVGIMTVYDLGTVCFREGFHTERYIFPVGYRVSRRYLSTLSPTQTTTYTCNILDGIDGPKFQVVPVDNPAAGTVISGTPTGAWGGIVREANRIRNRQHSNSVSGPDFFGLGQGVIRCLIQQLKGAERLAAPGTMSGLPSTNGVASLRIIQIIWAQELER
ncbi:hypothetical protein BT96DRAFT_623602 [Gymnopus androsaceus JB14]|uniref:FYR N-terminal domain-containing protein n=1 Tax=Gymnopus androsaceus JB14 TaxID=1447944 RepID=A0A6A4IE19_9AGAR|nr:hypothetical protein BT96DRAFT_623602 [Gymnopus androsaceus JB14]